MIFNQLQISDSRLIFIIMSQGNAGDPVYVSDTSSYFLPSVDVDHHHWC